MTLEKVLSRDRAFPWRALRCLVSLLAALTPPFTKVAAISTPSYPGAAHAPNRPPLRPPFRAAVYQCRSRPNNMLYNLKRAADALRRASDHGVELVVFPELFLQGFDCSREAHATAAVDRNSYELNVMGNLCQQLGVACILGYGERRHASEAGADVEVGIYDAAALFHSTGERAGNYRKVNLAGGWESTTFLRGDHLVESTLPVNVKLRSGIEVRCGVAICYDIESPEHCRSLVRSGAELLVVPTALGTLPGTERVATHIVTCRAMENCVHLLYSNYEGPTIPAIGAANIDGFVGLSAIVAPDGEDLIRAPSSSVADDAIGDGEQGDGGRVVTGVGGSSIIPCEDGELYACYINLDAEEFRERRLMSPLLEDSLHRWDLIPKALP